MRTCIIFVLFLVSQNFFLSNRKLWHVREIKMNLRGTNQPYDMYVWVKRYIFNLQMTASEEWKSKARSHILNYKILNSPWVKLNLKVAGFQTFHLMFNNELGSNINIIFEIKLNKNYCFDTTTLSTYQTWHLFCCLSKISTSKKTWLKRSTDFHRNVRNKKWGLTDLKVFRSD